jgi:hypothetical protein
VVVVEIVGDRHVVVVPVVPTRGPGRGITLAAADEQDRCSSRVEGEQHAQGKFGAEFFHVRMPGLVDVVHAGSSQTGAVLFEQRDPADDRILVLLTEGFVPLP